MSHSKSFLSIKIKQCLKEKWSAKGNFYTLRYIYCGVMELKLRQILLYHMAVLVFQQSSTFFFFSSKNMVENSLKLEDGDTK